MKFMFCVIATGLLAACGTQSSDDEQVRALITSVEEAAEARDTSDVLEFVAPDYSDKQGLDKSQLQTFLRGYFLSHPKIELLVNIETLEFPVDGLAKARVGVGALHVDQASADAITLDVELRKLAGDWRVVRADRVAR